MKRLLFVLMVLSACKGEDGLIGPEGPAGRDGTDGLDGAVNVSVIQVTLTARHFTDFGHVESAVFLRDEITQEIVNGGLVLAYTDLGTDDGWIQLPFVVPGSGNAVSVQFAYRTGEFEMLLVRERGEPVAEIFAGFTVKIILIPPGQLLSASEVRSFLHE